MIVSAAIILPLALMKHLGMFFILFSSFSFRPASLRVSTPAFFVELAFVCCIEMKGHHHFSASINHSATCCHPCPAGYLGYTSGFSLSCMVFFLISVSFSQRHIEHAARFRRVSLINRPVCLPRSSTRNSTPSVRWRMHITTPLPLLFFTLPPVGRTTPVRPNCLPSTRRYDKKKRNGSLAGSLFHRDKPQQH